MVAQVAQALHASTGHDVLWLIPLLPLAGSVIDLFFGKRLGRWAGILASATVLASFVVGVVLVHDLGARPEGERLFLSHLFDWISVGAFHVGADLQLDALSATMILVVTGVGALITIYAIGYMRDDPRYGRFFAYMNLFVFFMLMLVMGANYLVLYLGWEGVGLCSYLLIGFWFEKPENAEAAKKAFITTRIGDTAMLVGIVLIGVTFGTLDFAAVFGSAGELTKTTATVIALLLFAGAVGKSAQVPLHVWLPDAMAGPTPVSALIHAATMVTAGVYLVVRSHVLFEMSGVALDVVAVIGTITLRVRRDVRAGAVGHQARVGVFHDQPARVHVPGGRSARLRDRDVLPGRARVLQGAALPGLRLGDPRHARRAGPAADGRPATRDADHRRHDGDRRARARGLPVPGGVLREGPRPGDRRDDRALDVLRPGNARRRPVRALHRAAVVPDVRRAGPQRAGGAGARVRADLLGAARGARRGARRSRAS